MRKIALSFGLFYGLLSGTAYANDPQDVIAYQNQTVVEEYLNQASEVVVEVTEPMIEEPAEIKIEYDKNKFDYFVKNSGAKIAADPMLAGAIMQSNERYAGITSSEIDALDQRWRNDDMDLINPYMDHVLSHRLRRYVKDYDGVFTEMFVINQKGLNVGMSHKTGDFLQGDEAQFQVAFNNGEGGLYVRDPYYDEDMGMVQIMTALPVKSYIDGSVIGTVSMAINPNKILR